MCCTMPLNTPHGRLQATPWTGGGHGSCGCGCIGRHQTTLQLEHYQEHLKAELKSVEHQINALKKNEK